MSGIADEASVSWQRPSQRMLIFRESCLMRITYPSLLLAVLALASCGGGGSDSGTNTSTSAQTPSTPTNTGNSNTPTTPTTPTPTPTTPTPTTPAPVSAGGLIEYYGDSTIWGCKSGSSDCSVQVAIPAPLAFAQALSDLPKYTVANEGVSGSTSCDLLNGTDGKHSVPWSTLMTTSQAKYVIVNHGINDALKSNLSEYRRCLTALAEQAKRNGKQFIFETPNPIVPMSLDNFVQTMKAVAAQEGMPVIDQYGNLSGRNPSDIAPDGLHPTDAVYIEKGQFAAAQFRKLFP
jgi:lysophospholipase L1-like esterase